MATWVIRCTALALVALCIFTFNDLIVSRNRVRAAWSGVNIRLQRRHDLVPQLVTTVLTYAVHESATLAAVAKLRSQASVADRGQTEQQMAAHIQRLLALPESHPQLEASDNFLQLQRDLVRSKVNCSKRAVPATRPYWNTTLLLFARPCGFLPAEFFQADAAVNAKV